MKTNKEFKAEVFRRRDEYYKKRNKRIRIAAISSAPLVCLAAFIIAVFPAMMPAKSEDPYAHYSGTEYVYGEEIRVNVKEIFCVNCVGEGALDVALVPEERAEEFLDFLVYLTSPKENTDGEGPTVGVIPGVTGATTTAATTTSGSTKTYYKITLNYEFGGARTYTVYEDTEEDTFYLSGAGVRIELTYSQFKYIESILK